MELKEIREELLQAIELITDFEHSHLAIDRDTALVKLRRAYEALRFCNAHADVESFECIPTEPCTPEVEVEFIIPDPVVAFEPQTEEVEDTEVETIAEPEVEVEVEAEPEIPEPEEVIEETIEIPQPVVESEPEVIPQVVEQPEQAPKPEVVVEPESAVEAEPEVVEPEPTVELEPVVEPEPAVEPEPTPAVQTTEPSLFGDDDIWSRPTPSRRKIISLYGDEEHAPKPRRRKSAPTPAEDTPASPTTPTVPVVSSTEPPQILADTIEAPKSIADTIVAAPSVAESSSVSSLHNAISVGDRFMLLRELFNGNEDLYDKTLDTLDAMDNLDDCIIYIAENFCWRSSSDGAKLIMDLLQRKLG